MEAPKDPDFSSEDTERIGRIIQSEQSLSDYFTTIIAKSVTEQIEKRTAIRLRLYGLVALGLISIVIPSAGFWIGGMIDTKTGAAIDTAIDKKFEESKSELKVATDELRKDIEGKFENELLYSTLATQVLSFSQRETVTHNELNQLLDRLNKVASDSTLTQRTEFPQILNLIVKIAVERGTKNMVSRLENEFESHFSRDPAIVMRLARYHGEHVVGDHFISVDHVEEAAGNFTKYLKMSSHVQGFERLLPLHMMVIDSLQKEGNEGSGSASGKAAQVQKGFTISMADIMSRTRDIEDPRQLANFIYETVRYSNPRFRQVAITQRSRRLSSSIGDLVVKESGFFADLLRKKFVREEVNRLVQQESSRGNESFAESLANFTEMFRFGRPNLNDLNLNKRVKWLLKNEINPWLNNPTILRAITEQNVKNTEVGITLEEIEKIDQDWRNEFKSGSYNLIQILLDKEVSHFLDGIRRKNEGAVHEIVIMDNLGLLVGACAPTTDYLQADELKFSETYEKGSGSVHVGEFEFDRSAMAWLMQISVTISGGDGKPVGAATVGIDPSSLIH